MRYVSFTYYESDTGYSGTKLHERQFNTFGRHAEEFVDAMTFRRLRSAKKDDIPAEVKNAVCELAEWLHEFDKNGGKTIQSETSGNYAVSYQCRKMGSKENDMMRIVYTHLSGSPLLYRGV